jgi:hypothetical protein
MDERPRLSIGDFAFDRPSLRDAVAKPAELTLHG